VPPLAECRAAAWRMANVDDLRNVHYDSGAISTVGATHGGCVIKS